MKRYSLILAGLLSAILFTACNNDDEYRIHGRVTSNDLEGIRVVLVPVGHEEPENVLEIELPEMLYNLEEIKKDWHTLSEVRMILPDWLLIFQYI